MTMDNHARLADQFGCELNDQGQMICDQTTPQHEPTSKKKVAIWGSARTAEDSKLFAAIKEMAAELSADGWVVVTGGGPGSMEAANRGALEVCKEGELCSIAEAIELPFEEAVNSHVQQYDQHAGFFTRLAAFSEADAFIITPGGVGTLLELALIYQLVQVGHVQNKTIICVGRMWRTLREWLQTEMVESGFVNEGEMDIVHYVDRFSEAAVLLKGLTK